MEWAPVARRAGENLILSCRDFESVIVDHGLVRLPRCSSCLGCEWAVRPLHARGSKRL